MGMSYDVPGSREKRKPGPYGPGSVRRRGGASDTFQRGTAAALSIAYLGGWQRPTRDSTTIKSMRFSVLAHNAKRGMSAMRSSQSAENNACRKQQSLVPFPAGKIVPERCETTRFYRMVAQVAQHFRLDVMCGQPTRGQIAAPRVCGLFDLTHAFIEELVPTFPGDAPDTLETVALVIPALRVGDQKVAECLHARDRFELFRIDEIGVERDRVGLGEQRHQATVLLDQIIRQHGNA